MLGDYTDAMLLEDIAHMMDLLTGLNSLDGLLDSLPMLKDSSQWLDDVMKLLQTDFTNLNVEL